MTAPVETLCLAVACPRCGARAESPCVSAAGEWRDAHEARRREAGFPTKARGFETVDRAAHLAAASRGGSATARSPRRSSFTSETGRRAVQLREARRGRRNGSRGDGECQQHGGMER